jgi:hypothetical protein
VKRLLVLSLLLGLTSYAGTIAGTQIHDAQPPKEGYVPEVSTQSDDKSAKDDSCEAAYKKSIDSGVIADAVNAAEICKAAVDAACERGNKNTGDARLVAAICRLKAAHGAYLKVQDSK